MPYIAAALPALGSMLGMGGAAAGAGAAGAGTAAGLGAGAAGAAGAGAGAAGLGAGTAAGLGAGAAGTGALMPVISSAGSTAMGPALEAILSSGAAPASGGFMSSLMPMAKEMGIDMAKDLAMQPLQAMLGGKKQQPAQQGGVEIPQQSVQAPQYQPPPMPDTSAILQLLLKGINGPPQGYNPQ